MKMNRREAVVAVASGVAMAGVLGTTGSIRKVFAVEENKDIVKRPEVVLDKKGKVYHDPLPYVQLDPNEVAERAHTNKLIGDCMYGVFATLVEVLAGKVGGPYLTYPTTVTRYGKGGVMGWGTTCGVINGAAMAAYLVSPDPGPIVDEIINYYQYTALPDIKPKNAKMDIVPSVAGSTLCHVSISQWCKASGLKTFSPERTERCAQLAANTARQLVTALNAQKVGTFKTTYAIPAEVTACRACHDKGGELENTRGKMSCTACHDKHDI
jgi:hypothetical protein